MKMGANKISFIQKGAIEMVDGQGTHSFPFHTHESFMIGVILEGKADFRIGTQAKLLEKDMVYTVPSNVGISITPHTPIHYITLCIKGTLRQSFNAFKENFYDEEMGKGLVKCIHQWRNEEIEEREFIQSLIKCLGDAMPIEVEGMREDSHFVEQVAEYIRNHIEEPLKLDDLVEVAHVSKYYLVRAFTKKMGIGPIQYAQMCKLRFLRAHMMQCSEAELAYRLNFSSQGHMCTTFKKYMGITPKRYIKSVKEQ